MANKPRPFKYNRTAGRYIDASGRFVSRLRVREAIDNALKNTERDIKALSERLRTRQISVAEFQREMMRKIKDTHLYSAAASKGGWAELSPSDLGRVGQIVKQQYKYLQNFVRQIEGGLTLDGRFVTRTGLYSEAGRSTYEKIQKTEAQIRGFDQEKNVRHANESCSECINEDSLGWVEVGTLVPIGERICLLRCKCTISYRKSATNEVF